MKKETLRKIQIVWCFFIGIGALVGGACMLIKPDGSIMSMQPLLPYFKVLPFADALFQDYIFPGIALIFFNGLTQIFTAVLLLKRHKLGSRCGIGCGVILMLWICIQFVIFPFNFLSTAYFIFGLIEVVNGSLLYRAERNQ